MALRSYSLALLMILSGCDTAPMAPDAGTDSAVEMADASTDSGLPDTGVDAAVPDAGFDAGRLGTYGDPCMGPEECETGACLGGGGIDPYCTRVCDINTPNACRAEGTLCVATGSDPLCFGPALDTGIDTDDAILNLGDCVTRTLSPLGADSDLFQVRAATSSPIVVTVQPESGVDIQLSMYGGDAALVARQNMNPAGGLEGLSFLMWTPDSRLYVVVEDAGSTIANPYRICVALM